jgi:ribosomal protein S6--L-glutamate ligase
MKKKLKKQRLVAGWREWAQLPELGVDYIKVKIDTGAKTSSLHAFQLSTVKHGGQDYVKFDIHPIQDNDTVIYTCISPIVDYRWITSSTGHRQQRFIIETQLKIGDYNSLVQLSLANRDEMGFRMLIGRAALKKEVLVDPAHSFLLSHKTR